MEDNRDQITSFCSTLAILLKENCIEADCATFRHGETEIAVRTITSTPMGGKKEVVMVEFTLQETTRKVIKV